MTPPRRPHPCFAAATSSRTEEHMHHSSEIPFAIRGTLLILDDCAWHDDASDEYGDFVQDLFSAYYDHFLSAGAISTLVTSRLVPALEHRRPQLVIVPLMAAACMVRPLLSGLAESCDTVVAMMPMSSHPQEAFSRYGEHQREAAVRRYDDYVAHFGGELNASLRNINPEHGSISCVIVDITHSYGVTAVAIETALTRLAPTLRFDVECIPLVNESGDTSEYNAPDGQPKLMPPREWGINLRSGSSRLISHLHGVLSTHSTLKQARRLASKSGLWVTIPGLENLHLEHEAKKPFRRENRDFGAAGGAAALLDRWSQWPLTPLVEPERLTQLFSVHHTRPQAP